MDNVQQYVELPISDYDAWRRRVVDGSHQPATKTSRARVSPTNYRRLAGAGGSTIYTLKSI